MSTIKQETPGEELPITQEMRLTFRQWAITLAIVAAVLLSTPYVWKHVERFETGSDYRVPYALSSDYWLFDWRLEKLAKIPSKMDANPDTIVMLGDSVVWGEYVKADGTLPHFLNKEVGLNQEAGLDQEAGQPTRFVNGGVNGLFPLALEGLVRNYGGSLRGRKVIVVCNLLWLSSPKADMQTAQAEEINHASLLPQFVPRVPCYQADANARIGAVIGRNIPFFGWVKHLQDCYFQQKGIVQWTLAEDPDRPRFYPNSYKNPLAQITLAVPSGEIDDAERGPGSQRHRPWTANGAEKTAFDWVDLTSSLQWAALRRTVMLLRERGNDVLVIVAPFNGHMMADESRAAGYNTLRSGVTAWLAEQQFPCVVPDELSSDLYADASHPLTAGYERIAKEVYRSESFQKWISRK